MTGDAKDQAQVLEAALRGGLRRYTAAAGEIAFPAVPGLLGLPRDYINAQFGAWRNHTRHAAAPDCMAGIAERLSITDVAAISQWLSRQPVPADVHPAARPARPLPLACGSMPDSARLP